MFDTSALTYEINNKQWNLNNTNKTLVTGFFFQFYFLVIKYI